METRAELESPLPALSDALTPRAIACALLLGTAVCLANTYFGLQAGTVNAMPMQSALLAFAIFQSIQRRLSKPLSPSEVTLVEVTAGALGLAPFTSGFTSFIPALEFLATPDENGPVSFTMMQLLLWSAATCGLGIVVAAAFRRLFILRERLQYPSAAATGTLIGLLFGREDLVARAKQPTMRKPTDSSQPQHPGANSNQGVGPAEPDRNEAEVDTNTQVQAPQVLSQGEPSQPAVPEEGSRHAAAVRVLLVSLTGSAAFTLVAHFLPILRQLPIFGIGVARSWLWSFDLSPAYFGYGIIIGPSIDAFTLLGAVVGWGILSPLAKHNGWAPGPVDDWEHGSRGWILWVGVGLILGESAAGIGWLVLKPLLLLIRRRVLDAARPRQQHAAAGSRDDDQGLGERTALLRDMDISHTQRREDKNDSGPEYADDDDWPGTSLVTVALALWTGAGLILLYIVSVFWAFHELVPALATMVVLVLIPFAGFVSMRSLGETDNGAALAIGRVAQLVIGLLVPQSSAKYTSANLLLGGAVESGASQAAQQMGGLKTAYLTQTAPRAVFYGQMIGSFAGALLATLLYRAYTAVKTLPSAEFGMPDAYLYIVVSRLLRQQSGMPPDVLGFFVAAAVLGAAFGTIRILASRRWWRDLVPSGTAMGIGMYIVPAITLPRALGGLILVVGRNRFGAEYIVLLCSATGLILGQGLMTPVTLLLDVLHVGNTGTP